MNTRRHRAGFTLIEVIIVIFLFTLLMLAIFGIYLGYITSYSKQNASIDAALTAATVVNEVHELALQARAIATSRMISGTTYTTSSTTLVLQLPAISGAGNIVTGAYDYAVLYRSGSMAYRILEVDPASARLAGSKRLSSLVDTLTFTYDSGDPTLAQSVTVDVQTKSVVKQESFQTHLTQKVYLRNF